MLLKAGSSGTMSYLVEVPDDGSGITGLEFYQELKKAFDWEHEHGAKQAQKTYPQTAPLHDVYTIPMDG